MTILIVAAVAFTPQSPAALAVEPLVITAFYVTRYALFIRLFRGVPGHQRLMWSLEWVLWAAWVLALPAAVALLIAADLGALYVLALWSVVGFVLIVWTRGC